MRFSRRRDCSKIWIFFILLVVSLFMTIGAYAQSKTKIEPEKASRKVVPETPQGLKMVADVLDAVGGKSESDNLKMQISAGAQPSPIGKSEGTVYKVWGGYVYAADVTPAVEVPSMSQWGMIILVILIVASGIFVGLRKAKEVPA